MPKLLLVAPALHLIEAVHVELAHERREVLGLEVAGQNLKKLVRVRDDERVAGVVPLENVLGFRILLSLRLPF